jgi:dATP pyrophosphohydrolase
VAVKLAPQEHVSQQWLDWRKAAGIVFSWTNVEAIRELGKRHGQVL